MIQCEYCSSKLKSEINLKLHLSNSKKCLKLRGLNLETKFICKGCKKNFMNNVNQILPNMMHKPVKSVHGYVIFSDFLKVKNKIVIKTPKTSDEIRNMLFEYYIGSRFLNKLRSKTPNFMYTYGIFMCNPLINATKTL